MRSKECFDIWQWNCGCLINYNEISMPNFISIVGEDILYKLSVVFVDIYPQYCLLVSLIGAVNSVEILAFLVL